MYYEKVFFVIITLRLMKNSWTGGPSQWALCRPATCPAGWLPWAGRWRSQLGWWRVGGPSRHRQWKWSPGDSSCRMDPRWKCGRCIFRSVRQKGPCLQSGLPRSGMRPPATSRGRGCWHRAAHKVLPVPRHKSSFQKILSAVRVVLVLRIIISLLFKLLLPQNN